MPAAFERSPRPSLARRLSSVAAAVTLAGVFAGCSSHHAAAGPTTSASSSAATSATPKPTTKTPAKVATSVPESATVLGPGGRLSDGLGQVVFLDGAAWAPLDSDLVRIDPASGKITKRIALGGFGAEAFEFNGDIGVNIHTATKLVDPNTDRVVSTLPTATTAGLGYMWGAPQGTLHRIEASGRIRGRLILQSHHPVITPQIATGDGSVWVTVSDKDELLRVNPDSMFVQATIHLPAAKGEYVVGFDYGSAWVQQSAIGSGKLYRVDPATNRIAQTISLGNSHPVGDAGGHVLAFDNGSVWTADRSPTLTRVDAATGHVTAVRAAPIDSVYWIAIGSGSIWISSSSQYTVDSESARQPL